MTIKEFAKAQGAKGYRQLTPWHGSKCYELLYGNTDDINDTPTIGIPQIAVQNRNNFKLLSYDEFFMYSEEQRR